MHSLSLHHEYTNMLLLSLMCADGVAGPQVTNTQSDVLVSSNESARLELSSADRWFIAWFCSSTRLQYATAHAQQQQHHTHVCWNSVCQSVQLWWGLVRLEYYYLMHFYKLLLIRRYQKTNTWSELKQHYLHNPVLKYVHRI